MRKKYSKELLTGFYMTMLRIRLCEESFVQPIVDGDVRCPVHLYSGEEAVATGVCSTLSEHDYVFGNHRSHGHYLAKGGSLNALVAEIYGKETGCARGRGGSMHILDTRNGMMGAAPIVAGTISLALGAALAIKIRNQDNVSVSFFGDGATGEGVLYESLNFAALNKLPIIFVCENNFYSTHMSIRECRPSIDIVEIARPWGIYGMQVDGNDVLQVYETALEAVELCKKNKGPVLMECITYRLRGHVGPDDNIQGTHTDIRPAEEIAIWREKDPLKKYEKFLINNNKLDPEEIQSINDEVVKEIENAHKFANESPYPEQSEVANYVFN